MYFYPWLCCWCGNLQNNHKGLNPQNGNSPLLFQLKKFHRTAINVYTWLHLLFVPKRDSSVIFNPLITSIMVYMALWESFSRKKMLISERNVVTLCMSIGASINFSLHFKFTHFLQHTETPMLFLCHHVNITH